MQNKLQFRPADTNAKPAEKQDGTPTVPAKAHSIQLAEHRLLAVTGVKSVPTFTDKLIEVELEGETLTVTGHDLVVKGLDLDGGVLNASGYVTSMRYSTASAPSSIIKRIFK